MLGQQQPWQQQFGESLAQAIGYFIVAVVTFLSTWLANWRAARRRSPYAGKSVRDLHLELRDDIEINVCLEVARFQMGALRCFLSRIHNGDDTGARKKTRTHERVEPSLRVQVEDVKGVPIGRVTEELNLVIDKGVGWVVVKELPECKFKQLCEDGGAGDGAVARVAVKSGKEVIGFVGADFRRAERPVNLQELEKCALAISRILSRYHR